MTIGPRWMLHSFERARPSPARVYDALLGGMHNFAVDREVARELLAAQPQAAYWAWVNRAFLGRALRFVLARGVQQVLDLGSGLPTVGNVHEIAASVDPRSRVVYVDVDAVVVAYGREILRGNDRAAAIWGDLRTPARILADPVVRGLIDLAEPVAVLAVAALHFAPDSDGPGAALAWLRHVVSPGSCLVLSHATPPPGMTSQAVRAAGVYGRRVAPLALRSRTEIASFFDGWDLVEPGLTGPAFWRPEPGTLDDSADLRRARQVPVLAGVAVKP